MAKFKEGDVVMVKSGGPLMTVEGTGPLVDSVTCVWFEQAERFVYVFNAKVLILINPVSIPDIS